jgi:hypothetical protein
VEVIGLAAKWLACNSEYYFDSLAAGRECSSRFAAGAVLMESTVYGTGAPPPQRHVLAGSRAIYAPS